MAAPEITIEEDLLDILKELDIEFEDDHGDDIGIPKVGPSSEGSTMSMGTQKKKVVEVKKLNLLMVTEVIAEMVKDPILSTSMKIEIADSQLTQLAEMCKELDSCIDGIGARFSGAVKEKTWSNFYKLQFSLSNSIVSFFPSKNVASFFLLLLMKELISVNLPVKECDSVERVDLFQDDIDIVTYIGGFVLFRAKKRLQADEECVRLVSMCVKESSEISNKLILCKTRGGLLEPVDSMSAFFSACELIFRHKFDSFANLSCDTYLHCVYERTDVVDMFYRSTCSYNVSSAKQEKVLDIFLRIFFKLRCHGKCRQFFERHLLKHQATKKQKALRKSLKTDSKTDES